MKRPTYLILFILLTFSSYSQVSIDSVLTEIESNNTTLLALRKDVEANKIGNKTGIWLSNPEVEFNYLWGNPSSIGNRTDFAVSQSFDFPTAYAHRQQISDLKSEQAVLEYKRQRLEIISYARLLCVQLVYKNAREKALAERVYHAKQLANSYQKKAETGESSRLEVNRAQVYWLNLFKEMEQIEIERDGLLNELALLNGGNALVFTDSVFTVPQLLNVFEQWYAQAEVNNPELQWLKRELDISNKQRQLELAKGLPSFSAGYMSEKVVGEQFQGISLGVSIPLWENKNAVKYSKAKIQAVEALKADAKLQFYNELKLHYNKVAALQKSVNNYQSSLKTFSNAELVEKALALGEISLSEYYMELSVHYESMDRLLEMKNEMNKAYCHLLKYL